MRLMNIMQAINAIYEYIAISKEKRYTDTQDTTYGSNQPSMSHRREDAQGQRPR